MAEASPTTSDHRIALRQPNGVVNVVKPLDGALEWVTVYNDDLENNDQVIGFIIIWIKSNKWNIS